jgi:hypothetical protein
VLTSLNTHQSSERFQSGLADNQGAYAIRKLLVVTYGSDRKGREDWTSSVWNSLDNGLPTENKSRRRREHIIGRASL